MATAKKAPDVISIPPLKMDEINVRLVGRTGLYINRMSAKARRQLLIGAQKKTLAERKLIKHDPRTEYRDAMYVDRGWHPRSHVRFPAMSIKAAMGTAALMTPGIRKTDVSRLVFIPDEYVPIYGIPRLRMTIMRSADINRTPDVRTRPYFAEWATEIRIQFAKLSLSKKEILTLLANAGTICGIGDERQEKGKGSAGTFAPANTIPDTLLDADAQWAAIKTPVPFDLESAELLAEFDAEVESRL
ncbi:MAG: hypothetical protein OXE76_04095 [Alphaproteobacteria bacterium]|nr:hypothetical protein [Alphaproteobacteria bacterium]